MTLGSPAWFTAYCDQSHEQHVVAVSDALKFVRDFLPLDDHHLIPGVLQRLGLYERDHWRRRCPSISDEECLKRHIRRYLKPSLGGRSKRTPSCKESRRMSSEERQGRQASRVCGFVESLTGLVPTATSRELERIGLRLARKRIRKGASCAALMQVNAASELIARFDALLGIQLKDRAEETEAHAAIVAQRSRGVPAEKINPNAKSNVYSVVCRCKKRLRKVGYPLEELVESVLQEMGLVRGAG